VQTTTRGFLAISAGALEIVIGSKKKLLVLPVTGFKKIGSEGREKFLFLKIFLFIVLNFELLKVCVTPFLNYVIRLLSTAVHGGSGGFDAAVQINITVL